MRAFWLSLVVLLGACASTRAPAPPEALSQAAPAWLAQHDVPSVAIAFIGDGRLAWSAAYGERAAGAPARVDTPYNVASLAKPVAAEVMLRAVSAGAASLDAPMSSHWIDPDIVDDPRRDALTLRTALLHQTGFANWRWLSGNVLRFQSAPGEGFTYSGEGFEYARRYVQASADEPFEAMAQRLVFDPLGMRDSAFTRRPWFEGRIAIPHDAAGAALTPDIREDEMRAADDLYTTVGDYARFMLSVMNHEGLSPEIAAQRFTYRAELRDGGCGDEEGRLPMTICPDGVGMAMGWMVFRYGDETVISHTGSDEGEQTIAFFVPERRLGLVIFTNGANGRRLFPEIVAQLYPNEKFVAFLRMQAGG